MELTPAPISEAPAAPTPEKVLPASKATEPPPYATDLEFLKKICSLEPTRGSGPGGQRRNKVETGVRLTHPPSGLAIVATKMASREANIADAFERLVQKLRRLNHVPKKRKPTKPTQASKLKRLESKQQQSTKKASRKSFGKDQD